MKALDKLRAFASDPLLGVVYKGQHAETIHAIADAIDAEVADMQAFCDRLKEAAERREDVTLWGTDYTPLHIDANGEPIHGGDMVTEHEDGHTFRVDGFKWWVDEWWVFQDNGIQAPAVQCTHYHPPTVEDVLRAMLDALDVDVCDDPDATIAEYAAKLRLAGDGE